MINLLPSEYTEESKVNIDQILIGVLIFSLLLVPLSYYIKLSLEINRVEAKLELVNTELSQLTKKIQGLDKLKKEYKSLKTSLKKREEVVGAKVDWSTTLKELQQVIPDRSWIKEFQVVNHQSFKLTGYALDNRELGVLVEKLKMSSHFRDISINISRQKKLAVKGYKKQNTVYYQISGRLRSAGDNNELE